MKHMRLDAMRLILAVLLSAIAVAALCEQIPELPAEYTPQTDGNRYNSNEPTLITDPVEASRLAQIAPQWMIQALTFPPPGQIARNLGAATDPSRQAATSAILQLLNPSLVPDDLGKHLIPMSRWAVFYEDWKKHGGIDVFLTKYTFNGFTVLIAESNNQILVAARELQGDRARDYPAIVSLTKRYADKLLTESAKPLSEKDMKLFRNSIAPPYVYGYFTPKIDLITSPEYLQSTPDPGPAKTSQPNTEPAKATVTRFFCNGEFAAFLILKPQLGTLKNPFEPRFRPLMTDRNDPAPVWEGGGPSKQASEATTELRRRQVREYLGDFFYDSEGNALTDRVPLETLEEVFRGLTVNQKVDIARRKTVEEDFAAGIKAFAAHDISRSIVIWTHLLDYDPENARAAILLELAIREKVQGSPYFGNREKARKADPELQKALAAVERQVMLLRMKFEREDAALARERKMVQHRTNAIDMFSEGRLSESLKEWDMVLELDPGNANGLLFRDIIEDRIKETTQTKRADDRRTSVPLRSAPTKAE